MKRPGMVTGMILTLVLLCAGSPGATDVGETPRHIRLHNSRLSVLFDKQYGLPLAITLLPEEHVLLNPGGGGGSIMCSMAAETVEGEPMIDQYQYHNIARPYFRTRVEKEYAEVSCEIVRVDSNKTPVIKIEYNYRLANNACCLEARYTVTALAPLRTGGCMLYFCLAGDTAVYLDEAMCFTTKYQPTLLNMGAHIHWNADIAVEDFWMASRKSDGLHAVAIILPGPSNLRHVGFQAHAFMVNSPSSFSGILPAGAAYKQAFYVVGVRRLGTNDDRAELLAVKKVLKDKAQK